MRTEASLQDCHKCHDAFPIARMTMNGDGNFYCEKCLRETNGALNELPPVCEDELATIHAHKIHASELPNYVIPEEIFIAGTVAKEKETTGRRVWQTGVEPS